MGLTNKSLIDLGFKPEQRNSVFKKRYVALVYRLTKDVYLYKNKNSQKIFKSFIDEEDKKRYAYEVIKLNETGVQEMKDYLERIIRHYAGNSK